MSAVKVAAVPALAAVGLGVLAVPAFALLTSSEHLAQGTSAVADGAPACQAWQPVLPGLLYLGTAPVLTIGGVPLLGHGSCLPGSGKGYDIAVGANVALPPQSVCDSNDVPLPLLKVNLGLAIGVPDEDGYDPCQAQAGAAGPAQAGAPQVIPPHLVPPHLAPPHLIPPHLIAPHPNPPQVVPPYVNPPQVVPPHVIAPHLVPPRVPRVIPPHLPRVIPRPPQPVPPSSALGSPPPNPAPPPTRPAPPPTTPAAPPATTPAAVVPPPRRSPPPPRRPRPAPPVKEPAAAPPVTAVVAKSHPRPHPHVRPAPAPLPPPPFKQAAPAQQPATTYKPGRPAMPVGVLVTVVLTPCVATAVARLGRAMAGR